MWVGVKMLLLEVWKVPTLLSLGVVTAIITVAVVASLRATRGLDPAADDHATPAGAGASPHDLSTAAPLPEPPGPGHSPAEPHESPADTRATTTAGGQ